MKLLSPLLLLSLAPLAPAQVTYGFDNQGHAWAIDFGAATATFAWDTGGSILRAVAQSPDQEVLYGCSLTGEQQEIRMGEETISTAGSISPSLLGLAYHASEGQYYGASWQDLYRIDWASGAATHVGAFGALGNAFELAYHPGIDSLLVADPLSPDLFLVDSSTGQATSIGPHGVGFISGIWHDAGSGRTFGVTTLNYQGALLEFDVATGAATVLAFTGINWVGIGGEFAEPLVGSNFCGPALVNSSGQAARLRGIGSASAQANDVRLEAFRLPQFQFGYFVTGQVTGWVTPTGSQGVLCLDPPIGRFRSFVLNTGPAGSVEFHPDLTDHPLNGGVAVQPGETWHYQLWFRDQNPGSTSNFTDGLAITFQ